MIAPASQPVTAAAPGLICPVCGGVEFAPLFGRAHVRTQQPGGAAYRITHSSRALVAAIVRCRGCGLGALPPQWVDAGHYAEGHDERFAQQAEVRVRNAVRLLELLPKPASGSVLLDVGSAYGFLLVAARALGYTAVGVEASQQAAEHARSTYGVQVFSGLIEEAPLDAAGFDVITLVDVIEHLQEPTRVVRQLHRLLRPGGRLVILTPDLGSVVARVLGRHWWALLDDHYFYFSRRTLPSFLQQHGFAVERLHSFGRAFPLSHWIFKLSQYSAGAHRVLDRVVRAAGLADVEIPLNLGDQMVCVARRV